MAGRVYTETFISTAVVGVYIEYEVPAGYRAVIRNVDAISYSLVDAEVRCFAGDALFTWHGFPVIPGEYHLETRIVARAGQHIGALLSKIGMGVTVTGYLFEDTGLAVEVLPELPPFEPPPLEWQTHAA